MVDIVRAYLDSAGIANYTDEDVELIRASSHPAEICSVLASLSGPSIIMKQAINRAYEAVQDYIKRAA